MGKVKPDHIKVTGREIMRLYSDRVTCDFEENKELLKEIAEISTKRLANRLAGYLVTLKKNENVTIIPPKSDKKPKARKKKKHKCKNKARGNRKRKI